ncbi:hypothetical protein MHU86_17038 [Fragilaria crotonensis]|nr:hypothetical protein MHU86_17038 [Fragilaria crotonensis]
MDSNPTDDVQDQTYDDIDDRSWLKFDDAHQVRTSNNDEKTTIAIVQQFIHELIESVETSCAKFGCRTYHPDESEYAVEGMLSLTNSVHLSQFPPLHALASQEDLDDCATNGGGGGGVHDETFVSEDNGVWDAVTDEATF